MNLSQRVIQWGGVIPMVSPSVCCIDTAHCNRSSCSGSFKMAEKNQEQKELSIHFLSVSLKKKTTLTSFVHNSNILFEYLKEQFLREWGVQNPYPSLWCIAKVCWSPLGVVWSQLPGELSLLLARGPSDSRAVTQLQICHPSFILHYLTTVALEGKARKVNNSPLPPNC